MPVPLSVFPIPGQAAFCKMWQATSAVLHAVIGVNSYPAPGSEQENTSCMRIRELPLGCRPSWRHH